MYDPVLDKVYQLFRKGMGYVHEKHIYKFKDYSECVFDTQIQSKWWLTGHLTNPQKRGNRDYTFPSHSISSMCEGICLFLFSYLYSISEL